METTRAQIIITSHITKELTSFDASIKGQLTQVASAAEEIVQNTKTLSIQTQNSDQRTQILKSLKFPGMNERWNHVAKFHEQTFEWILKPESDLTLENESDSEEGSSVMHLPNEKSGTTQQTRRMEELEELEANHLWDNFSDWLMSDSKVYWICGKPGSGKSTLIKYLCCNPLTKDHLNVWHAGTIILRHFLWKPGSILQQNIKGLLCSLLHQALSQNMTMLDALPSRFQSVVWKECCTDWSAEELKATCLWVLENHPSALCIFIDGLDEIYSKDGARALLQLIDDLKAMPKVKVCLASRPESRFQRTLCKEQHLELQYLTITDMQCYAKGLLTQPMESHGISNDALARTVDGLVDKAEGVFLWLHLAVRSLINGIENGDSAADLGQRLESLPTELSELYSDIWARLNEDTAIYRQSAAIYFNLIIMVKVISQKIDTFCETMNIPHNIAVETTSVFHLMAATNTIVQTRYLSDGTMLQDQSLDEMCFKTCNDIRTRSAGLVEISSSGNEDRPLTLWNKEAGNRLLPHARSAVRFIHRSAYDFLIEEQEGLRIRAYDSTSQDQQCLQLLKGALVYNKIYRDKSLGRALSVLLPLSFIDDPTLDGQVSSLFQICGKWYRDRHLTYDNRHDIEPQPQFLALAAIPKLRKYVLSSISQSKNPPLLATLVLRDLFGLLEGAYDPFTLAKYFLKPLLSLGADPNLRGMRYVEHSDIAMAYDVNLMPLCSAFGELLERSVAFLFDENKVPETRISDVLEMFLHENANLELRIPLLAHLFWDRMTMRRAHFAPYLSFWDDAKEMTVTLVIDATAAFWIQVLCRRSIHRDNKLTQILFAKAEASASSSSSPSVSIAGIIFSSGDVYHPINLTSKDVYRPLKRESTNALLGLAKNWLLAPNGFFGPNNFCGELWQEAKNVVRGMKNPALGYEKLECSLETHLAKINCGYCLSPIVKLTTGEYEYWSLLEVEPTKEGKQVLK